MFCRELFGKKPKKLDFGLQPHKIPDCDVVSNEVLHALVLIKMTYFYYLYPLLFLIHYFKEKSDVPWCCAGLVVKMLHVSTCQVIYKHLL